MDLALTIGAAPFWLPVFALTALLVRMRIGTPIFFRQERPGLGGKPFVMTKFRTMSDERDAEGNLLPDAERLKPAGKLLRASSLDELPELFNVLKGDMSLVGPRPLLMEYLERYSPEQARRHEAKPGITGLAQVGGRNALPWPEVFKLDVRYVDEMSPALDITILWRTISGVLAAKDVNEPGQATRSRFQGEKGEE
jgi:lipopolysaccharide/colanic/teichoic acid biosynthesis glycosyltransferase